MLSTAQSDALKALGSIEGFKNDLKMLGTSLGDLPLWLPSTRLKKQCDEAYRMIGDIAERFERRLVVTIVGPSGAGKSTLLDALVGIDDLSPVGRRRPTTDHVILFSGDPDDAEQLIAGLGRESVEIKSSPAAEILEHVIIIDTPDTDSVAYEKHGPLVSEAIARSDMLICVFDSENPKRKDHVDFLAPIIRKFNGESLISVINKCDRQDESELKKTILPDFSDFIKFAWQIPVNRVLCVSARRHLQNPRWDQSAKPKHDFDQFPELQQLIFENINRAGYVVDRRVENARSLRDFVFLETRRELDRYKTSLTEAAEQVHKSERISFQEAVSAMKNDDSRQLIGVGLMVYQKMAQQWVGPMGWMIAIWARLLIFGTGIAALFRFGRPVSQIMGMVSAWRQFKESKSAVAATRDGERVGTGMRTYRLSAMSNWPVIAGSLIEGGFHSTVREVDQFLPDAENFSEKLALIWNEAFETVLERISGKLSGMLLQTLFNLPVFAILGYTGWVTVHRFLQESYLSVDFFLHALWTIGIILLLSFFILQTCVRLIASPERVTTRAFETIKGQADHLGRISSNPVLQQLEKVIELDSILSALGSA
jgi:GTPase SAR1 family protein